MTVDLTSIKVGDVCTFRDGKTRIVLEIKPTSYPKCWKKIRFNDMEWIYDREGYVGLNHVEDPDDIIFFKSELTEEETKMTEVDVSKIKVGDKVTFRKGPTLTVTEVKFNPDSSFGQCWFFKTENRDFYGHYFIGGNYNNAFGADKDIIAIIPASEEFDVQTLVEGDKLIWKNGEVVTFRYLINNGPDFYSVYFTAKDGDRDYWNYNRNGKFHNQHDNDKTIVGVNGKLFAAVDNPIVAKEFQIAKLQEEIESLKKELAKKNDLFWPQEDDEYFYVDEQGEVGSTYFCEGHDGDDWNKLIGNCYKTREEAARQITLLRLAAEIKRKSFQPDWDNHDQPKHYAYFDHDDNELDYAYNTYLQESVTYFETREKVKEAFKDVCKADFLDMKRKGLI